MRARGWRQELSNKIVQILEPAVGQGKVRPQVSVLMNFQQVEETVEQYDPQGSVVRSQEKRKSASRGLTGLNASAEFQDLVRRLPQIPQIPAAIAPGAAVDTAAAPAPPPAVGDNLLKQDETINYEVSKAVRHVVNPVGKVERVSVAVVIDNHTKITTSQDGQSQTTQEPRNADEMKKYKDLISAAIGFNPTRGDQLTVENISFEGEVELVESQRFLEKQGPVIVTGCVI
jgi:flagellar M-ring protein FliF